MKKATPGKPATKLRPAIARVVARLIASLILSARDRAAHRLAALYAPAILAGAIVFVCFPIIVVIVEIVTPLRHNAHTLGTWERNIVLGAAGVAVGWNLVCIAAGKVMEAAGWFRIVLAIPVWLLLAFAIVLPPVTRLLLAGVTLYTLYYVIAALIAAFPGVRARLRVAATAQADNVVYLS